MHGASNIELIFVSEDRVRIGMMPEGSYNFSAITVDWELKAARKKTKESAEALLSFSHDPTQPIRSA